jgi:AAA+ ATPase superfamily predicted ATPase
VLVIDELQVIGDLKIDGLLIYKLFNFFIRLTKELHLAHVFVITSDSLFIEQVYSEAMLEGRCRYLLVDDFDNSTTINFLDKYKFSDTEKEVAWSYCGGKPVCLVELINARENRKRKAEEMLKIRKGQIEEIVYSLEVKDKKMFDAVVGVLSEFMEKEKIGYKYLSDEIKFLVGKNIIFADSANKELRPQSRLNLLAIREVMRDA